MKRRNLSERSAIVAKYHESGQTQEAFAKENDVGLSSLSRWIYEARRNGVENKSGGGYFEVDAGSFSSLGSVACRVVVGNLNFEFGALPGAHWLAEFADAVSMKAMLRK
jgi:hypothetical protein